MTPLRDLFLLRRDVTYLNHGSFGACPRSVFEAYQALQLELEREPVDFLGRRFNDLMQRARERLASYVGARADDLVFVPNATTGLNAVARSLRLGPGDEVLATDHEYGALDRTWTFMCEKAGARYVRATVALPIESQDAIVEAIWSRVSPRTRILFLSHVTAPTAIVMPVRELVRRARERGILTVIDGAHAPGQVDVDVEALGADFYSGNCHKWLCAPKGSAFLWVRRDAQRLVEPLVVSWGWRPIKAGSSRFVDEHEWAGTRDVAAYLAVPAAIGFLETHAWSHVRTQCHGLASLARERLNAVTGLAPICPETMFAQMATIALPDGADAEATGERLRAEHHVEAPFWMWNGRPLVRVSAQAYNDEADIERFVSALAQLLGLG